MGILAYRWISCKVIGFECMEREGEPGLSPQEKVEDESENGGHQEPPAPMNLKEKQKNMYVFIHSKETMFVEGRRSQQF